MKTIEVVAAIIVRDGEVFCTQRGYGEWQGWYVVHYGNYVGYAAAAYIDT